MEDKIPAIMDIVFECTLEMINKDFHEYPEHRVEFFKLLQAINLHCFPALLKLDAAQFKFVIDSCMWASKHDNREVEEHWPDHVHGADQQHGRNRPCNLHVFFQKFYTTILQDVFFVLTDSDHKAGFKYQSMLLARMFYLVGAGRSTAPSTRPSKRSRARAIRSSCRISWRTC